MPTPVVHFEVSYSHSTSGARAATDARLTLRVYARAMSQDHGERERLQTLVNGHSFGHQWALEPSGTGKAGLSARAG